MKKCSYSTLSLYEEIRSAFLSMRELGMNKDRKAAAKASKPVARNTS